MNRWMSVGMGWMSRSLGMRSSVLGSLVLGSLLVCSLPGCGEKALPPSSIQEREKAFEDAQTKLAIKDYAGAKAAAMLSMQSGGLSVDQAAEAGMILIESAIQTGDLATAETELKAAELYAMDMVKLHLLQGLLAKKQGNEAAAQEAFAKARSLDPSAPIPN